MEAIEPGLRPVTRRPDVDLDSAFASARPRLLRIATSLVGADAAEDVVQDTYLTARARISQLRDPAALEAWLARICVHRSFRIKRRGKRLQELLAIVPFARGDAARARAPGAARARRAAAAARAGRRRAPARLRLHARGGGRARRDQPRERPPDRVPDAGAPACASGAGPRHERRPPAPPDLERASTRSWRASRAASSTEELPRGILDHGPCRARRPRRGSRPADGSRLRGVIAAVLVLLLAHRDRDHARRGPTASPSPAPTPTGLARAPARSRAPPPAGRPPDDGGDPSRASRGLRCTCVTGGPAAHGPEPERRGPRGRRLHGAGRHRARSSWRSSSARRGTAASSSSR